MDRFEFFFDSLPSFHSTELTTTTPLWISRGIYIARMCTTISVIYAKLDDWKSRVCSQGGFEQKVNSYSQNCHFAKFEATWNTFFWFSELFKSWTIWVNFRSKWKIYFSSKKERQSTSIITRKNHIFQFFFISKIFWEKPKVDLEQYYSSDHLGHKNTHPKRKFACEMTKNLPFLALKMKVNCSNNLNAETPNSC